ncbi:MAG TPA: trypsin-like peptidase domain-containing protein [Candidatus Saccharimonadales bacterium]|jgi:S1-C subfamily serine protease|nr:trypsin-like peptidase domain-containing protein [Candidatus Saccharimonadales bacterium]
MKFLRLWLLVIVLVSAFYCFTTYPHGRFTPEWVARPTHVEITEAAASPQFDSEELENIGVYKKALPFVVNITSTAVAYDFFYGAVPQQGQGSGFVIDSQGRILTNYHVVENARQVDVTTSDKKRYKAQIVGADPTNDLAVIQIPFHSITPAVLADSKGLVVGQKVFAIGNPFGLSGTMTRGIISSIRSVRGQRGFIDEAIQTDAAINPGNSGGPLLNSRGEVIGINSMIFTGGAEQSAGIGFAIPINTAKAVLDDLVKLGQVRRPALGVRTLPVGPQLAGELALGADSGLLIQQVVPGSSADRAGLRGGNERAYIGFSPILIGGDLIVAVDGQDVQDTVELSHVMQKHHTGDVITVTVYRAKKRIDIKVTLGEARETA